jgi:hypothetical protein
MLAIIHPDSYTSPKDLAIQSGALVLLLLVLWAFSPRGLLFFLRRREKAGSRRFNRKAQRMIRKEKKKMTK